MRRTFCRLLALLLMPLLAVTMAGPSDAATRSRRAKATTAHTTPDIPVNRWTLGLAAGRIEGAPLRYAAELARELDDEDNMRLLPIVTRGPYDNVKDLLYLKGVDLAVVSGDILEHIGADPKLAPYRSKIAYVMQLVPAEVHLLVAPGINSLQDLEGKPVNFNSPGTQAAYTGPILFKRLGIHIVERFDPHQVAMSKLASGQPYAAVLWVSSKPIAPLLRAKPAPGVKLLAIPPDDRLLDTYLPSRLTSADYPGLVPAGTSIDTVAVPTVLAAFNFTNSPDRQRRMARFIDYIFARLPGLQSKAGYDAKWKDINLAASVPGWRRLPAMQAKLDAVTAASRKVEAAAGAPAKR